LVAPAINQGNDHVVNNLSRLGACCLAAVLLPGCNSLMNDSYETLKLAISGPESLVTVDYVNRMSQPGLVVQLVQSEALLVRASEREGLAVWRGINQMLVTHNGRIVQAAGMSEDSDVIAPLAPEDPLRGDLRSLDQAEVIRLVDYPDRFLTGIPQIASYQRGPMESLQVMGANRQLQRLDESVSMPALDYETTNYYWFDPASGEVIVSVQHIAPGFPSMRLTEVRPSGYAQ
jgi:hypothetical protein